MSNTNKVNVPEAKGAMNRFKMECASEVGVQLTDGYNGNLTISPGRFCGWTDG